MLRELYTQVLCALLKLWLHYVLLSWVDHYVLNSHVCIGRLSLRRSLSDSLCQHSALAEQPFSPDKEN